MENTAILILKAALDFNSEMVALATQVVGARAPIRPRTITRIIDQSVTKYQEQIKKILEQDEKRQS